MVLIVPGLVCIFDVPNSQVGFHIFEELIELFLFNYGLRKGVFGGVIHLLIPLMDQTQKSHLLGGVDLELLLNRSKILERF